MEQAIETVEKRLLQARSRTKFAPRGACLYSEGAAPRMRYEANIGAPPIAGFKQEDTKTIKPSEDVGCVAPSRPGDSAGSMHSMALTGDRACPPHLSPRFLSCSVGPVSTLTIAGSVGAARNRHRNRIQQPGRGPGPVEHQAPCMYVSETPATRRQH